MLEQQLASALCHKTQHALFVRRTSEDLGRKVEISEVVLNEESLHRVYPREIENDPVYEMLKPTSHIRPAKESK